MLKISYFNTDLFWALHIGEELYIQKQIEERSSGYLYFILFQRWGKVPFEIAVFVTTSKTKKIPLDEITDIIRRKAGVLKEPNIPIKLKPFIFKKDLIKYAKETKPLNF